VSERRARALAPVRWSGTLLLLVGALGVSVALVGAAATAAAEVRGRWREAAVRAAMGASPWSLARRFLGRILVTALLALGAGWVVAWSLVAAAGSGDGLRSGVGALLACALLAAALGGGWTPARRAGAVEPARLLREG
jgi:ABC-type lipoprotein release transport system permease subunit